MQISNSGVDIRGGPFSDVSTVSVDSVSVSSVTFSGLDQTAKDVYAVNFTWYVDGTGSVVLLVLPNGAAVPTGSIGFVTNVIAAVQTITDAGDLGFCRLLAAAAGAVATGTVYFVGRSLGQLVRYIVSEWYANDATLILGDRLLLSSFSGIWNDVSADYLTSMTLSVQGGASRIGLNSIFRLVKA